MDKTAPGHSGFESQPSKGKKNFKEILEAPEKYSDYTPPPGLAAQEIAVFHVCPPPVCLHDLNTRAIGKRVALIRLLTSENCKTREGLE